MYIEMVDMGFKYTMRYYYAKQKVFDTYAKDVSDMTIDKYELERRAQSLYNARNKLAYRAISLCDPRFDFDSVLPKKIDADNSVKRPITILSRENTDIRDFL